MDTYLLTVLIVLVIGAIGTWIRKRYLKKVMSKGLGRKVEDRELTDIAE
jgi:energy-converting hydrogenase Eha subunit C